VIRLHSSLTHGPLVNMNTSVSIESPEALIQRQLDAYNAHDLDGWLATYAEDAQQFEFPATPVAAGHAAIRARMVERFKEPDLHARLIQRAVMGNVIVDHEEVTRNFPEGIGRVELVAFYQVTNGRIQAASFVFGAKTLD
jgi:hypothetical protein